MRNKSIKSRQGVLEEAKAEAVRPFREMPSPASPMHFWERAFSRRRFVRAVAGVTGVVVASRVVPPAVMPGVSWADNDNTAGVPPFDFADAFYLQHGINPANILHRVDGTCLANDMPACSV